MPADVPPEPVRLAYFSVREVRLELPDDEARKVKAPRWQLKTAYGYVAEDGRYFVVPAQVGSIATPGQYTDLASVPGFLWGLLGPYGRQLRPALLHDHLCDVAKGKALLDEDDRDAARQPRQPLAQPGVRTRKEADYLFREALRSEKVGPVRSWLFFTGVSFGRFGGFSFLAWRAVLLGVLSGLSGLLAWHALTVALGGGPRWADGRLSDGGFLLAMLAVAVLLAVLRQWVLALAVPVSLIAVVASLSGADPKVPGWSHSLSWHAGAAGVLLAALVAAGLVTDIRVALTAAAVVPLILPVVLVTTLTQLVLGLPDLVNWALRGYPVDYQSDVGPTLGRP